MLTFGCSTQHSNVPVVPSCLRITPRQLAVLALSCAEARRIEPSQTRLPEGAAQVTSLAILPRFFDTCEAFSGSYHRCRRREGKGGNAREAKWSFEEAGAST